MIERLDKLPIPFTPLALLLAAAGAGLLLGLSLLIQSPERATAQAALSESSAVVPIATAQTPAVRVIIASPYNR